MPVAPNKEVKLEVEKDWFEELVAEELLKEKDDKCADEFKLIEDVSEEIGGEVIEEAFGDVSGEAFVVAETVQTLAKTELYDSGCTNHISPYKSDFNDFQTIETRHFRAANKQTFSTIGKGELVVDIPNDNGSTQLRLQEVLYSPEVSYTLISIGRLNEDGFSIMFGGGKCIIHDENKDLIGVIPKTAARVYKVEHEEMASGAEERLSLGSFHQCMGHISPDIARKLVKDKMVTGIRLEYTPFGRPFFCASCIYVKATRKPVPKMREGEHAEEFGGEVHSDVWGPALVESRGGRKYYVTFINDKSQLTTLYLLKTKDEVPWAYKQYEAWVETQMGKKVKVLNSD